MQRSNCMAMGQGRQFVQDFAPPVSTLFSTHGQFERRFAPGKAPHRRRPKEPPAQGVQLAFLQLAQSPLQQHAQVAGREGHVMHRLRAPELVHAQPIDPLQARHLGRVPVFIAVTVLTFSTESFRLRLLCPKHCHPHQRLWARHGGRCPGTGLDLSKAARGRTGPERDDSHGWPSPWPPNQARPLIRSPWLARPPRLERGTLCLEGRCSIQLSYGRNRCQLTIRNERCA
jgi:hypothetical protein